MPYRVGIEGDTVTGGDKIEILISFAAIVARVVTGSMRAISTREMFHSVDNWAKLIVIPWEASVLLMGLNYD